MADWSAGDITINSTLQVHSGYWVARVVHLQISKKEESLALKYLGINNILNNTSTTQLNILSTDTRRVTLRTATRRAKAAIKIMVYNSYVLSTTPNIITGGNGGEAR